MPGRNMVRTIAIAAPPRAQAIDVSGPIGAFQEANRQSDGAARYAVRVLATEEAPTVEIDGLTILADGAISDAAFPIDTLLVAGTHDYRMAYEATSLQGWLRQAASRTRRIGSVCTGAFFLGAAGLLDGRQATTHWQHAAELAHRFPEADVLPDAIFVKDGPLYTSAGITAGIDLSLQLIEEDHGRALALKVARRLVVFLRRQGGQSQYSAQLAAQIAGDDRIQAMQQWIEDNLKGDLSLTALADKAAMSVRNFSRVFRDQTGETPADYVELVRLDAARRLLEGGEASLQAVALACGFSNADVMRRAFLRRLGIGPSDYRQRFRA